MARGVSTAIGETLREHRRQPCRAHLELGCHGIVADALEAYRGRLGVPDRIRCTWIAVAWLADAPWIEDVARAWAELDGLFVLCGRELDPCLVLMERKDRWNVRMPHQAER